MLNQHPCSCLFCLFQSPVNYSSLKVKQVHRNKGADWLVGMCYSSGRLYTTEMWQEAGSNRTLLAVYSVTLDKDTVSLLDTLDLEGADMNAYHPRIDHQNGKVYIPCESHGICVARYDGSKLVRIATLRAVVKAMNLAVVSPDTLYVCDWPSHTVCVVDVSQDRVTARLRKPGELSVTGVVPDKTAVLGDTVLVGHISFSLAIYRHGVHTPGKLLTPPQRLDKVYDITTDHHFSFLLACKFSDRHTVLVFDINGNLTHTIPIPGHWEPRACTVVEGEVWVACKNGYTNNILVLS